MGDMTGKGGEGESPFDEDQMMNMFKGLLGGLNDPANKEDGSNTSGPNDSQMDEIMKQFTSFLQETDNNNEFKGVFENVVKEMFTKESMYLPMKNLKEAYPGWLEKNWESLSDADLERYNEQVDKIGEICTLLESIDEDDTKLDKNSPEYKI
jgi:hypothetical protein